jgi:hypothetical protein
MFLVDGGMPCREDIDDIVEHRSRVAHDVIVEVSLVGLHVEDVGLAQRSSRRVNLECTPKS